ncbi:putative gustatory receptor 28b [Vespa mandarinia]|uniref:putative gustatory receptor 28b n=1 Tax=Vespa mandarinia TaxID=7446 RepID=UPI001619EA62|nr:putative gustatory receptor 28b [Vespa mandarinia]
MKSYLIVYDNECDCGFMRRKRIQLFIERIEICTREMNELNVSENYSSLFRYLCIAKVFLISIISGLCVAEVFWFSETVVLSNIDYSTILQLYYTDLCPVIEMLINDLTFVFWIRYIKVKFGQLNTVLQSMLRTTIDSPQHKRVLRMKDNWEDDSSLSTVYGTYKTNENLIKLKRVKQIHLELMKCARIINEAYGLQILISIFTTTLFITTMTYNLYVNLNKGDKWIIQLYVYLTWIFYFATMISVKACVNNVFFLFFIYAANTREILYELYEPSTSRKFRDQIRDFMFQLIQNRLNFTVCGFYDLNHTLIYSVIGSITTYLIIFIQVGGEPKIFYNNTTYNSMSTK